MFSPPLRLGDGVGVENDIPSFLHVQDIPIWISQIFIPITFVLSWGALVYLVSSFSFYFQGHFGSFYGLYSKQPGWPALSQ